MSKPAMKSSAVLFGGAALALAACSQQAASTKADEDAIRAQNQKWLEAIVKHDADAIAALYAQDGEFMPPNSGKVSGHDAIKAAWQGMFQIPGVGLTFTTDKFVFGKSTDLAVDIGSYDFKSASGESSMHDKGKSVVTWVKRDGNWQVLTDMFSSDAPMLPPTPTPPATAMPMAPTAAPGSPAAATTTPAPATPPAH